MKKFLITILLLAGIAGCSPTFPLVQDTRTATPTAIETATPVATATPTPTPTPLCEIKGNVATGRIYHMPGQPTYNQTQVNPERGDRWFCTEQEAQAAGFTKAKR